jgi:LysM repeat protein
LLLKQNHQESEAVKREHDESKFIYHSLKPGETVYSLSKLYGVSENEIIQSNPGIDINKLSVGIEIAVPKREFMNNQQKFDDQEKKYIFHKVLMGETLSSIARQYGLSVRQLRRENRDLRFPQVGDFVRIPGVEKAETGD